MSGLPIYLENIDVRNWDRGPNTEIGNLDAFINSIRPGDQLPLWPDIRSILTIRKLRLLACAWAERAVHFLEPYYERRPRRSPFQEMLKYARIRADNAGYLKYHQELFKLCNTYQRELERQHLLSRGAYQAISRIMDAASSNSRVCIPWMSYTDPTTRQEAVDTIHEIFGNPFYPHQRVNRETRILNNNRIGNLANEIYYNDGWKDLPILADMMEDTGYNDQEVLAHLRGQRRCYNCVTFKVYYNGTVVKVGQNAAKTVTVQDCDVCKNERWIKLPSPHFRGCWALDVVRQTEYEPGMIMRSI